MAKGNLFLGDGHGSVGDVTMYVKGGNQISRVRRRVVGNPNTRGQLVQRAILATVGKAYQAGSAIFDHSFEGKSVGAESQACFQKLNLNRIRQLIVDDLEAGHTDGQCQASVVGRGSVYPVANPYRISTGSLSQDVLQVIRDSDDEMAFSFVSYPLPSDQTLAQYLSSLGVVADDIFTVVAFGVLDYTPSDSARYLTPFATLFGYARLKVKDSAVTSSTPSISASFGDIFEIEAPSGDPSGIAEIDVSDPVSIASVIRDAGTGSMGIIRSRDNLGLRSTCDMMIAAGSPWGYNAGYLYDAWDPTNAYSESDLILEGGGL